MSDLKQFQELVKEHGALFVDLKMVNLAGRLHHVTLPAQRFDERVVEKGIGFDGSSYGFRKVEASDMVMVPDLSTAHLDPFRQVPTLSVFSTVRLAEPGLPVAEQDTRSVLLRAIDRMRELGVAEQFCVAPEYEFYIFRDVERRVSSTENYVRVSGEEEYGFNTYHLVNPGDRYDDFRDKATRMLLDLGMPVKYHHHETGGHGQQEIEFALAPANGAGDNALLVKYVLQNLAEQEGLRITFMPKPLHGEPGNGWHVHQQLRVAGESVFYDPEGIIGLSRTALCYIGGMLAHSPALTALANPSTNSYKRLSSGHEAPSHLTFGPADRTAAVRIPKWAQGKDARVEYRPGDLTCNPYLNLAAMLMAGLDGIERRIDPVTSGFGPAETLDPEQVRSLPRNLEEALDALEADHDFLTVGGVFSGTLIDQWLATCRGRAQAVAERPHPYEFELYFDC